MTETEQQQEEGRKKKKVIKLQEVKPSTTLNIVFP